MSERFLEFMGLNDEADDGNKDSKEQTSVNSLSDDLYEENDLYTKPGVSVSDNLSQDVHADNTKKSDIYVENISKSLSSKEAGSHNEDLNSANKDLKDKGEVISPKEEPLKDNESKNHSKSHRRKKHRRKFKFTGKKIVAIVCAVLVLIVGIGFGSFQILRAMGEANLKKNATSQVPEIEGAENGIITHNGQRYKYNDSIITLLCLGIDNDKKVSEAEFGNAGQSDAIFLMVLDVKNKKTSLVALSRDIMTDVEVPAGSDGQSYTEKKQLTLQYAYWDGKEQSGKKTMEAVSKLMYNLPVHGYVAITLNTISRLNDAVGGITVTVPREDSSYLRKSGFRGGETVTLRGEDAFWFVKYRDTSVSQSNNLRVARQKQYLNKYINAFKAEMKDDLTFPVKVYQSISGYINTDLSLDRITYLATLLNDFSFDMNTVHTVNGTISQPGRFEEFEVDEKELKDLVINVFYEPV